MRSAVSATYPAVVVVFQVKFCCELNTFVEEGDSDFLRGLWLVAGGDRRDHWFSPLVLHAA